MKLSKRLQMNVSLVPQGTRVADIGCDHGYASIWLVKNNVANKVIATDVNRGPIARAKEHVELYEVQDQVDCRLGNGTEKIHPGEVDTLMIAGMGGPLMVQILQQGKAVLDQVQTLVLQPQSEIEDVRRFVLENGYDITSEKICFDENKYYFALLCVRSQNGNVSFNKNIKYLRYGECLIREKNPMMKNFLEKTKYTYQQILSGTEWKDENHKRKRELEDLIDEIDDCLQEMA